MVRGPVTLVLRRRPGDHICMKWNFLQDHVDVKITSRETEVNLSSVFIYYYFQYTEKELLFSC